MTAGCKLLWVPAGHQQGQPTIKSKPVLCERLRQPTHLCMSRTSDKVLQSKHSTSLQDYRDHSIQSKTKPKQQNWPGARISELPLNNKETQLYGFPVSHSKMMQPQTWMNLKHIMLDEGGLTYIKQVTEFYSHHNPEEVTAEPETRLVAARGSKKRVGTEKTMGTG